MDREEVHEPVCFYFCVLGPFTHKAPSSKAHVHKTLLVEEGFMMGVIVLPPFSAAPSRSNDLWAY